MEIQKQYQKLEVTKATVYEMQDSSDYVKAIISIVLNGELKLNGIPIVEGTNGLFVSFPPKPLDIKNNHYGYSWLSKDIRNHIETSIHEIYKIATQAMEKPKPMDFEKIEVTRVIITTSTYDDDDDSLSIVDGWANVIINNQLLLQGISIVEGVSGPTVMYSSGNRGQEVTEIGFDTLTKELRDSIEEAVLDAYEKACEMKNETYDTSENS